MVHTFTTIRHSVEKLLEAEHFLARMVESDGLEFQFELNAFLSASRSVTFVLQKNLAHVPDFTTWYKQQQTRMKADTTMRFFLELRNISQKQGPVSFVGGALPGGGWTYRFVGLQQAVPEELIGKDITSCCAAHTMKLGSLLVACSHDLPFHSCPARAFTEEGMEILGYSFGDVEAALGLPQGWTDVGDFPVAEKLRILSRDIEPLDVESIERIANGDLRSKGIRLRFPCTNGTDLVDDVAAVMGRDGDIVGHPRNAFLTAILERIKNAKLS